MIRGRRLTDAESMAMQFNDLPDIPDGSIPVVKDKKCKHFAVINHKDGSPMYINTRFITSFTFIEEKNETGITVLGETKGIHLPGDLTDEIKRAIKEDTL